MYSREELVERIIDLRVDLIDASIPAGNCPYAYYTKVPRDLNECGDIDCSYCRHKFLKAAREQIKKEWMEEDKMIDTAWLTKAIETVKSRVADKLFKDNITIYRVGEVIRIDIKEEK